MSNSDKSLQTTFSQAEMLTCYIPFFEKVKEIITENTF